MKKLPRYLHKFGMSLGRWNATRKRRSNRLKTPVATSLCGPEMLEPRLLLDGSMRIGTNLDGPVDHGAVPFADVFNLARTWMTRNGDGSGDWDSEKDAAIPVDQNGWPTQVPFDPNDGDAVQIVHTVVPMRGTGAYKFKAEGTGVVTFTADNGHLDPSVQHSSSVTFTLTGEPTETDLVIYDTAWGDGIGSLYVEILSSDPSDHVRNLDLVLPGYDGTYQTAPFHPTYTDGLGAFTGLRFMDWGHTNTNPLETWDDRTTPASYTQTREQGASLEYIVQLANQLQQDAWVCLPHTADDAYVQQAAQYVRDNLAPSLKAFVEYSNETWNATFSQTDYVQDQGELLGLDANRWTAGQKYVAQRSAAVWQIFENEFGTGAPRRLIKVMATQTGNAEVGDTRMSAIQDPAINPTGIQPDVLATAPYYGYAVADQIVANGEVGTITADQILDRAQTHLQTEVTDWVIGDKALADKYDLWLVTYEGGQHLAGTGGNENIQELTDELIAANRDARMYDLNIEYLDMLRDGGVVLHSNFSYVGQPSKWGSWGVMEDQEQSVAEAHKYRALVDWIGANPAQNSAPKARAGENQRFIDDGDEIETITLDASSSRDLDGHITAYTWRLDGEIVGTQATLQIDVGLGAHSFELTVTDDDGVTSSDTVVATVAPNASANTLVQSDLTGTAPGLNTPWTETAVLSPNATFSGWTIGSGFSGSDVNDVLAFSGGLGDQSQTTLQDAINQGHYIGFSLEPAAGGQLDVRGASFEFTIDRIDWHSPRRYAIMTDVDGFQAGVAVFDTGSFSDEEPQSFSLAMPFEGFLLDVPIEVRVYAYEGQYTGHATSLSALGLSGGWVGRTAVDDPIADQEILVTADWTFTFPDNVFINVDSGTVSYQATLTTGSPLPEWLTFDGPTRTFAGTPTIQDIGALGIRVTATVDEAPETTASDTFTLTVYNPYQNSGLPEDVDANELVTPLDVLVLITDINANNPRQLPIPPVQPFIPPPYLDVNGDLSVAPLDVLLVINYLNRASGEGEATSRTINSAAADRLHSEENGLGDVQSVVSSLLLGDFPDFRAGLAERKWDCPLSPFSRQVDLVLDQFFSDVTDDVGQVPLKIIPVVGDCPDLRVGLVERQWDCPLHPFSQHVDLVLEPLLSDVTDDVVRYIL